MKQIFVVCLAVLSMGFSIFANGCNRAVPAAGGGHGPYPVAVSPGENYVENDTLWQLDIGEMRDYPLPSPDIFGQPALPIVFNYADPAYLHILNGVMLPENSSLTDTLVGYNVETIRFIPPGEAIKRYGAKALHGAVLITAEKE
jgi:hypothetical protein